MFDQNKMPQGQTTIGNAGKTQATIALVLGCLSVVLCFFIFSSADRFLFAAIFGIIGLVFARKAKKSGDTSTLRKLSIVLSCIGIVIGAVGVVVYLSSI